MNRQAGISYARLALPISLIPLEIVLILSFDKTAKLGNWKQTPADTVDVCSDVRHGHGVADDGVKHRPVAGSN